MPIRIPDALPATEALARENIFAMTEYRAMHQDIRPLRLVLVNLMSTKVATETQILRKLSNTPLQVEITLLRMGSHDPAEATAEHLETFYRVFDDIKDEHFDGMIITGAPLDAMAFDEVDFWDELCEIMDWSQSHVHSILHICWGAMAGIYHHYGVEKRLLAKKLTGVFKHELIKPTSPLLRGFDDRFWAPHSRYSAVEAEAIEACLPLEILATSEEAGVYAVKSMNSRNFFIFGHPEYDRLTLAEEYARDLERLGNDAPMPEHYFPNDNPTEEPLDLWCAHGQLLYTNWLNYYVYQTTPYDVRLVGTGTKNPLNPTAGAVRAENEDDDGYDPWSDRQELSPLFESDPWD